MRRTILLLLLLAIVLFSFAGRLLAATVIASAAVRHQACVTVYTTERAYRKLHTDCVFGATFE